MINLNKICLSALLLGAAAIATPAFAQAAGDQAAAPSENAQASPSSTNTPAAQAAESPAASTQASAGQSDSQGANMQASSTTQGNMQVADASPTTSKKYVRSHRAADFAKERSITAQLNQQASAAASPSSSVR